MTHFWNNSIHENTHKVLLTVSKNLDTILPKTSNLTTITEKQLGNVENMKQSWCSFGAVVQFWCNLHRFVVQLAPPFQNCTKNALFCLEKKLVFFQRWWSLWKHWLFFSKKKFDLFHTNDDFGFDLIDFPTPKFLKTRQICIKTVAALSHVKFTHMDHT